VGSPFEGFDTWENWVCNYDPPGNWVGEKPY
jgi:pathogenesis-related protein 1